MSMNGPVIFGPFKRCERLPNGCNLRSPRSLGLTNLELEMGSMVYCPLRCSSKRKHMTPYKVPRIFWIRYGSESMIDKESFDELLGTIVFS